MLSAVRVGQTVPRICFYDGKVWRNYFKCISFKKGISSGIVLLKHDSAVSKFDNFKDAFGTKKSSEIFRALFVINLCSYNWLVENSLKCLQLGERILGIRLFTSLMKRTFYGQFVGGGTPSEIRQTVESCRAAGAGPILLIPMEEDPPEAKRDEIYDSNMQKIIDCINLVSRFGDPHPMVQMKLTAIMPTDLCESISKLFPKPTDHPGLISSLAQCMSNGDTIEIPDLAPYFQSQLNKGIQRLTSIGKIATLSHVLLMVDAEYTCINPSLNLLTMAMMLVCNTESTVVAYTYQNYLKDIDDTLRRDTNYISNQGVCFGAKMVRGAYMRWERSRAAALRYPDPIRSTVEDTATAYRRSVDFMFGRIQQNPERNTIIVATHNEKAVEHAIERMQEYNIPKRGGSVYFAQIFGMGDYITYTLGKIGFLAYKSIPYGSLHDTLPYLSRRARENRAVLQGTRRDRELLKGALRDRFWP